MSNTIEPDIHCRRQETARDLPAQVGQDRQQLLEISVSGPVRGRSVDMGADAAETHSRTFPD